MTTLATLSEHVFELLHLSRLGMNGSAIDGADNNDQCVNRLSRQNVVLHLARLIIIQDCASENVQARAHVWHRPLLFVVVILRHLLLYQWEANFICFLLPTAQ